MVRTAAGAVFSTPSRYVSFDVNLEAAVERARRCRDRRARQGARTPRTDAREDEQRRMARRARCRRVRSALNQTVNVNEARKVSARADVPRAEGGQLLFPG